MRAGPGSFEEMSRLVVPAYPEVEVRRRFMLSVYALSVGITAFGLSGCFSYVPADLGTVPVGEEVRVYLTREGLAQLRESGSDDFAAIDQPIVSGTLTGRDPGQFSLLIPVTRTQVGFLQSSLGQQVTLPSESVVQVEQRRLNGTRTGIALVASTAAVTLLLVSIISDGRGEEKGPPLDSNDGRIPLFFSLPVW